MQLTSRCQLVLQDTGYFGLESPIARPNFAENSLGQCFPSTSAPAAKYSVTVKSMGKSKQIPLGHCKSDYFMVPRARGLCRKVHSFPQTSSAQGENALDGIKRVFGHRNS